MSEEMKKAIKSMVDDNVKELKAVMQEELKKKITDDFRYGYSEAIDQIVKNYIKDELGEEVLEILRDCKDDFLKSIRESVVIVASELGNKLQEKAISNINSYSGSQLVKGLFE